MKIVFKGNHWFNDNYAIPAGEEVEVLKETDESYVCEYGVEVFRIFKKDLVAEREK